MNESEKENYQKVKTANLHVQSSSSSYSSSFTRTRHGSGKLGSQPSSLLLLLVLLRRRPRNSFRKQPCAKHRPIINKKTIFMILLKMFHGLAKTAYFFCHAKRLPKISRWCFRNDLQDSSTNTYHPTRSTNGLPFLSELGTRQCTYVFLHTCLLYQKCTKSRCLTLFTYY